MNRRLQLRVVPTIVAAFLLVPLAGTALAQPTLSVNGSNQAEFSDTGTTNADVLTVAIIATGGGSTTYQFHDNAAILPVAPCTPTDGSSTTVNCVVPSGTGVNIDVGGAPGNAGQTVTLLPLGPDHFSWAGQISTITGGPGSDELTGAEGNETFKGGASADDFVGGGGTNTVSYEDETVAVTATIDGKPASGTNCPDAACEKDIIDASIQNLKGGSGNDVLMGNVSMNRLDGGDGDDQLFGLAANDTLVGDAGNDTYFGGPDVDTMTGSGTSDTVDFSADGRSFGVAVNLANGVVTDQGGGSPIDTISGIANVTGTPFADTLLGSTAVNKLNGLAGNDTIRGEAAAGAVAGDVVDGGAGTDTFSYADGAHEAGVAASLDELANDGLADIDPGIATTPENDNIHGDVENITGGGGSDTLIGNDAKNTLDGGDGVETDTASFRGRAAGVTASVAGGGPEADVFLHMENLEGGNGDDVLFGGAGANVLTGNGGNDSFHGLAGMDTFHGNTGSDTVDYSDDARANGWRVDLFTVPNTAKPTGDAGDEDSMDDIENAIGTSKTDTLVGSTEANNLFGLAGADDLSGKSGNDVINPGSAADGGADAADVVEGGLGNDIVTYAGRTQAVNITLNGSADDGAATEGDNIGSSVEGATGGAGDDTISADAAAGNLLVNNTFDGGAGADTITSLDGDDTVTGGPGGDSIQTGAGSDTLLLTDQTADTADCGTGTDTADADETDVLTDCEAITRHAIPAPPPGGGSPSTVSISNPSVAEGNGGTASLVFTVSLSAAQAAAVTVPFQTVDVTAKAAEDYDAQTGTLTFAAGETAKSVTVVVKGDNKAEKDEQVGVALSAPTGNASLGIPTYGVGTITNDDTAVVKKTPGLTARVVPKRDRTRPYKFVVTGRVKRPAGVSKAKGCAGKVRVQVKAGVRVLRRRSGFVDATCSYTVPMTLATRKGIPRSGRLRFVARFLGNGYLKPRTAKPVAARAG